MQEPEPAEEGRTLVRGSMAGEDMAWVEPTFARLMFLGGQEGRRSLEELKMGASGRTRGYHSHWPPTARVRSGALGRRGAAPATP